MSDDKKRIDEATGMETTGHSYDGIEELNTPLPRWWLWTFYLTIIWGLAYTIAYPAWPMVKGATEGVLGWSTRANVAEEITVHEARNAELAEQLVSIDLGALVAGGDLHRYAVSRGGAVFRAQCSQCHGSGAAGALGYPNLLDDDWLWGGTLEDIVLTVDHGVRNDTDPDARWSEMPAFGEMLERSEIRAVVAHVQAISGGEADPAQAAAGAEVYAANCASCHGDEGTGDRSIGAPNLTDAIWLYGGSTEALTETVENARFGVMPAWGERLTEADVRAVSAYVHALGGGE